MLAVNMIDVALRIFLEPFLGRGEELLTVARFCGRGGADPGTSGLAPFGRALNAEITFAHARKDFVPFVAGHVERAGKDTIAAPHAGLGVISDLAMFGLAQS